MEGGTGLDSILGYVPPLTPLQNVCLAAPAPEKAQASSLANQRAQMEGLWESSVGAVEELGAALKRAVWYGSERERKGRKERGRREREREEREGSE